jgi:hypothetical protein
MYNIEKEAKIDTEYPKMLLTYTLYQEKSYLKLENTTATINGSRKNGNISSKYNCDELELINGINT